MKRPILLTELLLTIFIGTSLQAQIDTKMNLSFEDKVQSWLTENNVPAVGIGLIEDGKIKYVKVFGELKKGVPAPDNTVFNVASMTKPVVAMLTLKLVEAGQWDLDETLFHYWVDPDVADDPLHKKLTSRHVLTHQTGFPNWRWMHPTKKLTFDFEPGTNHNYSGEGFVYLAKALERKFEKSLVQLSDSLLFKPLGMKDTRYYWDKDMDESRFAFWHDSEGNRHEPAISKKKAVNAGSSLLTTVEDYCKFGIDVMNGAGLSEDLFNDMISSQVKRKTHYNQGLGWGVVRDLPRGEYALEHYGSDRGVKTQAVFLPKSKRGIVVLTNGDNGRNVYLNVIKESLDIGKILLNHLIKNSDDPEIITLSDEILEQYVGTYESKNGDLFKLTKESGILKLAKNKEAPNVLYPHADDKFFFEYFDINIEFHKDDLHRVTKMVAYYEGRMMIMEAKKIN
ncbi:MAG: serine hydrolase [Sedimentisphaerales bacterium]|nr:serine hydrolase [Sedimentisphaerales bacterium]